MIQWNEIFYSLDEDNANLCKVNINNLTSHLDELYDKIAELEKRLDKQDEYQQEQND